MLFSPQLAARLVRRHHPPPLLPHIGRRLLSSQIGRGVSVPAMAAGMVGAAAGGIGIGVLMPTDWLAPKKKKDATQQPSQLPPESSSADGSYSEDGVVHENVRDIAEDIPRPAIIQDATRAEVEALYDFHTCIASGGSATVWRATEIATGRTVAIKVVDKRLLLTPFLNMEVASLVRCTSHPHVIQLYAAFDVVPDDVSPEGEWHLVMELAEGGEVRAPREVAAARVLPLPSPPSLPHPSPTHARLPPPAPQLFERLLEHGAYTEKVASQLLRQVAKAVYHLHSVYASSFCFFPWRRVAFAILLISQPL